MKILLTAINAKYIHSNPAVYSLRACVPDLADQIAIAEFTINNQKDYILQEIYKRHPDILCFSCYIWNLDHVESVMREFHKLCPEVRIWVGGPEVSYEVEPFLKAHPEVTGVMIGEGEETFRELCEYYESQWSGNPSTNRRLSDIAGIAYRKPVENDPDLSGEEGKEKIVVTSLRPAMDMSRIPFCYQRLEDFSNRIIYYESSRGCPFSCSYCLSSVDKRMRFRDIGLIRQELQFFLDQKVAQVKFVDRTFNCNHSHAMAIWQFIKEHDNGITNFHFEIAADLMNEEELALISDMRPGLIQLEIGVQSTNEATIQEIHRTMKLKRLKEVVREIQSFGNIHEHLDLIAGLPYEDYASFQKSFDEIYALKPNQLQLGFLKVLKGSYLYGHAKEYGILCHERPPYEVLATRWLTYEDVLHIKQAEEMLEIYYNSGQFEITILLLEKLFDSPFIMYQTLGRFYEEKGYFSMSHSRMQRCVILLEFLQECVILETRYLAMFEEALTFDLYYRENCKSRPAWAPDPAGFKQMSRRYCTKGKLSHLEPFHYHFPEKGVQSLEAFPEYHKRPVWVLFHYDKRDPLDHQAKAEYIKEEV